jgi:hypothetical protein
MGMSIDLFYLTHLTQRIKKMKNISFLRILDVSNELIELGVWGAVLQKKHFS